MASALSAYATTERPIGSWETQDGVAAPGGGGVDTIISIRRPDGNSSSTVRVLHCVGRFDDLPEKLVVDLDTETGEYRAIGTENQLAIIDAVEAVKANAPRSEDEALKESDLFREADVKRTTGQEAVAELLKQGVLRVVGQGVKGDPKRFWAPEPPMVSAATPGSCGRIYFRLGSPIAFRVTPYALSNYLEIALL